jgi:hypothetical protein
MLELHRKKGEKMRKSDKIIVIVFMILILLLGSFFIYSGVVDLLDNPDNEIENPVIIEIVTDSDIEDDSDDNTCPVLESIDDITITIGDEITVLAYATDEDGDTLTYSFSELPDSEVDGNKLEWQTVEDHDDEYDLTVSATDGDCTVTHTFTIYISDEDDETENDPEEDPTINTELPDLIIGSVTFDDFTNNGQTAEFEINVENQGSVDIIGDIEVQAEISISASGVQLLVNQYSGTITDLTSTETKTLTYSVDTSQMTLDGDLIVELTVDVDPNLLIEESDETNNQGTFTAEYVDADFDIDMQLTSLSANNIDSSLIEIQTTFELEAQYSYMEYVETLTYIEIPEAGFVKAFPYKLENLQEGENIHTIQFDLSPYAGQIQDVGNPGYDILITTILDPYNVYEEIDETNNTQGFAGFSNCVDFWIAFPEVVYEPILANNPFF